MFSYVDPAIRQKLQSDHRLVDLDRRGRPVKPPPEGAPPPGASPFVALLGPIPMPVMINGDQVQLAWYAFVRRVELSNVLSVAKDAREGVGDAFRELLQTSMNVSSALVFPGFASAAEPLVRIHSCCMTGDVFGSQRCECGPQLRGAYERIHAEGDGGAVIYFSSHEGRGIGLWAKAITYLLQDDGQDTYQANLSLGLPEDSRDFTDAGIVLAYFLGGRPIRLLSNNLLKREHVESMGVHV
ncbi:MAG: GTP cyclohydrolase II, partial [Deltaproteobacteria bacterium]|nr:GTP cyclohydrolase II [Deltaproteobacteria bacterium]